MGTKDRKAVYQNVIRLSLLLSIFLLLLPYIYLASETDHECQEEKCLICENISHCCDLISDMAKTTVIFLTGAMLFRVLKYDCQKSINRSVSVCISRVRIRMNN